MSTFPWPVLGGISHTAHGPEPSPATGRVTSPERRRENRRRADAFYSFDYRNHFPNGARLADFCASDAVEDGLIDTNPAPKLTRRRRKPLMRSNSDPLTVDLELVSMRTLVESYWWRSISQCGRGNRSPTGLQS